MDIKKMITLVITHPMCYNTNHDVYIPSNNKDELRDGTGKVLDGNIDLIR